MDYELNTILFATDLGSRSVEVFRHAAGIARRFGARIHVVHVVEPLGEFAHSLIDTYVPQETLKALRERGYEEIIQEVRGRLEAFCREQLDPDARDCIAGVSVVEGLSARVIVDEARRLEADLIVLGSHGQSALSEMLLGSVAHKVTMHSTVPVLLIPVRE